MPQKHPLTSEQQSKLNCFEKHVHAELNGDLETTMATMNAHPHLTNVPTLTGGVGFSGVKYFYQNHLVGKFFPPDIEMIPISVL